MKRMLFFKTLEKNQIQCTLCPFNCIIKEGKSGNCQVRINDHGLLKSLIYQKAVSIALDPIEKKPLYHFYPGSQILSIGTVGCNFHCQFCQNWEISQNVTLPLKDITPDYLLSLAKQYNAIGIAYTYSEPIVWFETVLETAQTFKDAGLKNIMITNGFINKEPLEMLVPLIDAMNIDVKSFNPNFYTKYVSGRLDPIKNNIEYLHDKIHLELTMLIIPSLNDNLSEVKSFVKWVASIDKAIPVHFSRYFPNYKMTLPPTPKETLYKIKELALQYLDHVYLGNI